MSISRIEMIRNGDRYVPFNYYKCERCGTEIQESSPYTFFKNEDIHICLDCSFIEGYVKESDYLNLCGVALTNAYAEVVEGKIKIWIGSKKPSGSNERDRNSSRYKTWRQEVFKRDKYTCRHCNQKGGNLNAHHIKPFAKYKKLRFDIENGLTLCESCHRKEHSKAGD